MKYIVKRELLDRGPVEPAGSFPVDGTLLVGETHVAVWSESKGDIGSDYCYLYPAYHNGNRAWVEYRSWSPGNGYSASGKMERVIAFEKGVELICSLDLFHQVFEKD